MLIKNTRPNLLLTGSTGFIGSAIASRLISCSDYQLICALRCDSNIGPNCQSVVVGDLNDDTQWADALCNVDVVIHTAGRVHLMKDSAYDPLTEFRKVNVEGTLSLARQASAVDVKRFIFISSIKVNGEVTVPGKPFSADDSPNPPDPYAISKREAEIGLHTLAKETGMEVVVIRPPLVYGAGVKANFKTMMDWINLGIPLPLGAIYNKRSFVALDNLVDLILTCIKHPAAANQTFLAADNEDVSTTELLQLIGDALGKPARLIPVPVCLLSYAAAVLGKKKAAERLFGSLQVDISKTRDLLGWEPPLSVQEGLLKAVEDAESGL